VLLPPADPPGDEANRNRHTISPHRIRTENLLQTFEAIFLPPSLDVEKGRIGRSVYPVIQDRRKPPFHDPSTKLCAKLHEKLQFLQ